jgi:hypothetical protein
LFHDLVISPEEYRREFLDIENLNESSEKEFVVNRKVKNNSIILKNIETDEPETKKINYINYIVSFLKKNKLYKTIKSSIFN